MRKNRIEIMARVLMGLVAITGLVWTYLYVRDVTDAVFLQDWSAWPFVDETLSVTISMRLSMLPIYIPMLVFGLGNIVFALLLLNLFQKSIFFDPRAAKWIKLLGLSMVGAMISDTLLWLVARPLYSRWNADGPVALDYYFDNGDIVIGLAGLGFVLCGSLMREAIVIAQETEGLV